jgi:hypothetical protein
MPGGFRRRMGSGGPRRPRRLTGCLLWIVALIIALVVMSLLFGGFQKGTKVGGDGAPRPFPVTAAGPGSGR